MHLLFFILAMIALSIFIIKLFGSGIIALITYKYKYYGQNIYIITRRTR